MIRLIKKALPWSAFFIACYAWLPSAQATQPAVTNCPDLPVSGRGQIKQIYDGDTVELTDGRKVRLLGINTPEINYRHGDAEPFAKTARRRLKTLVPRGTHIKLQTDTEELDRFGRLLAHLQLSDGTNPAVTLLNEGLATILILPPNTAAAICFANAEQQARSAALGIWAHSDYQLKTTASLTSAPRKTGYQVITGRVSRVTASKRFYYLELGTTLTLRINKQQWQRYFVRPFAAHWPGLARPQLLRQQTILARGWVSSRKDSKQPLQMRLYHPAGLELPL